MRTRKRASRNQVSSLKFQVSSFLKSAHRRLQTSDFRLTWHHVLIALAILVGAAATGLAFPWTQDMVRGRAVKSQTQMLVPPPNTLAVGHPRILDRDDADKQLSNPLATSTEVLEQGRALFATYCAVCHGADGRAGGPVGKYFRQVADLSAASVQAYSDGLIYSVIREGGFNMPGYAESLSPPERWAVVRFIRTFR